MQFILSEEQEMIAETARGFLADACGSAKLRETIEKGDGFDREIWASLMGELGFGGIAFSEDEGGLGLGHIEQALVMMEMGRVLAPVPYLPSICLSARLIALAGDDAQKAEYLPPLLDGSKVATLAGVEAAPTVTGADGKLNGEARFIPFARQADWIVVPFTNAGDEVNVVVLEKDTDGMTVAEQVSLDLTRPQRNITFDNVTIPDNRLLGDGDQSAALARTFDLARIAIAAEQVGAADAALDRTVEYSMERQQFGRPIGSFQAIKHKMADMMIAVESAKTAALYAACTSDEEPDEIPEAAAIAKARCSDAVRAVTGEMIQIHGGIGFTWEHDAHLFFKRARSSSTLLGAPSQQRETLAQIIGLDEVA